MRPLIQGWKAKAYALLRWSERYTKTDMVYLMRGGFWMNLSYVLNSGLGFLLSIGFANLISKDTYGTYQFILSIGSILGALTLTGMNSAVTQAVARGFEGTMQRSIPIQFKYNSFSVIAAFAVGGYYLLHGNAELAIGIALIGILNTVFNTLNTYTAYISGKKDFVAGFTYGLALNIPYYIVMGLSLFWVRDPVVLVLINLGVNTLVTIFLYFAAVRKYKPNQLHDDSAISFGKHLSLASVIGIVAGQIDNVLAFHFVGTTALAVYAFASTVPEKASGVIKSITVMAFPKLSTRSHDELKTTALGKSLRLAGLTVIVFAVYIAFAPLLFHIFFPQYLASVLYSQAYAVALVFSMLPSLPLTTLTAMQAKKQIYIYNIANPAINIAAMVALVVPFGIWGLIIGRAIAGTLNYLLSLFLIATSKAPR